MLDGLSNLDGCVEGVPPSDRGQDARDTGACACRGNPQSSSLSVDM
jgi:hypothetical protein